MLSRFSFVILLSFVTLGCLAGCPSQTAPEDNQSELDAPAAGEEAPAADTGQSDTGADTSAEEGSEQQPTADDGSAVPGALTDSDGDGIADADDPYPFDYYNNDLDGDGVPDDVDNCFLYNPDQEDADGNGVGDICDLAILAAMSTPPTTPTVPAVTGAVLVAQDGQFLGTVNADSFDPNSLANSFGTYGSSFNSLSIWNPYGLYGSSYNAYSPWNPYTSTPPVVIENNTIIGFVTTNPSLTPAVHPNDLAIAIGRGDVVRY
jgi:hypothetical protein